MMPKDSTRRFRFSLRTLLLVVSFLGIVGIPLSIKLKRVLETRAGIVGAMGEVERLHGMVEFDSSGHVKRVRFVGGRPVNDDDLAIVVPHLARLPALKTLELHSDRVTDRGLSQFAVLTNLEELTVLDSSITDAGVQSLGSLARLKMAAFMRASLTDTSLQTFAKLPKLEVIGVTGSGVTDDGLTHLATLSNLKQLTLFGTTTTDGSLTKLGEQLPKPLAVFDASQNDPKVY
jgi:hypothetical protein